MKPNQWIERARALHFSRLITIFAVFYALLTPAVWAAPDAAGASETASEAAVVCPDERQLELILRDAYPQLVTQRFAGTPVVTILFNRDGSLAAIDLEISAADPGGLAVSELNFIRFRLRAQDLTYMGLSHFELPSNTVVIMYAGKRS